MATTACKKDHFVNSGSPRFECKKCGARVKKEEKVCKPRKLESHGPLETTMLF